MVTTHVSFSVRCLETRAGRSCRLAAGPAIKARAARRRDLSHMHRDRTQLVAQLLLIDLINQLVTLVVGRSVADLLLVSLCQEALWHRDMARIPL